MEEIIETIINIIDCEGKERKLTIEIHKLPYISNSVDVCYKFCKLYKVCQKVKSPIKKYEHLSTWCFSLNNFEGDLKKYYEGKDYKYYLYPKRITEEYPELFSKNLRPSWKK